MLAPRYSMSPSSCAVPPSDCGRSNQPGAYGHETFSVPPLTVIPLPTTDRPVTVPDDTVPPTTTAWPSTRALAPTLPLSTAAIGPTYAPAATLAPVATHPPPFDQRAPAVDGFGAPV